MMTEEGVKRRNLARRTCEICGMNLSDPAATSKTKYEHYKTWHTEIQFKQRRQSTEHHTDKMCTLCRTRVKGYKELVQHYTEKHGFKIIEKGGQPIPVTEISTPVQTIDNFFGNIGNLIDEIKLLRSEKEQWQAKALKWSGKIVDLQEVLSRAR